MKPSGRGVTLATQSTSFFRTGSIIGCQSIQQLLLLLFFAFSCLSEYTALHVGQDLLGFSCQNLLTYWYTTPNLNDDGFVLTTILSMPSFRNVWQLIQPSPPPTVHRINITMAQTLAVGALLGAASTAFIAPSRSADAPALRGGVAQGAKMTGSSSVSGAMGGLAVVAAVAGATSCRAAAVKKKGVKVVHGKEWNSQECSIDWYLNYRWLIMTANDLLRVKNKHTQVPTRECYFKVRRHFWSPWLVMGSSSKHYTWCLPQRWANKSYPTYVPSGDSLEPVLPKGTLQWKGGRKRFPPTDLDWAYWWCKLGDYPCDIWPRRQGAIHWGAIHWSDLIFVEYGFAFLVVIPRFLSVVNVCTPMPRVMQVFTSLGKVRVTQEKRERIIAAQRIIMNHHVVMHTECFWNVYVHFYAANLLSDSIHSYYSILVDIEFSHFGTQ